MDPDDEVFEETVMLTRRVRRQRRVDATGESDDDADPVEEHTVVMDRRRGKDVVESDSGDADADADADAGVDESTRLIEERTVVIERRRRSSTDDAPAEEHTVAIDRRRREGAENTPTADDESLYDTVRRPPAPEQKSTPSIYKPRAAPRTPHRPPVQTEETAPTRVHDSGILSVTKAGRRGGIIAVAAVGGACVVSVVGLVLLAVAVLT
ncbi:hypothetical protein ACFY5A_07655 [Microbacterium sp. NPDC012755]|uniref:hypothetical protein n=1 Tax=Microbacterium sp. NPDC012755 TaxID=3364184 RepID=UPI00369B7579